MSTRHIALAATFLAIVFLAHAASRVTQMGGAQASLAVGIFILMGLIFGPELQWGPLLGIGIGVGLMLMLATSTPVPLAALVAGLGGFLIASAIAKATSPGEKAFGLASIEGNVVITAVLTWMILATGTWLGLSASPFASRNFTGYGLSLGSGYVAWWIFGFLTVMLPSMIVALILTPLLYNAVRPQLIRTGLIRTPDAAA